MPEFVAAKDLRVFTSGEVAAGKILAVNPAVQNEVGLINVSDLPGGGGGEGGDGEPGQRGSLWFVGSGPPIASGGFVGDIYLNEDNGNFWRWEVASGDTLPSWVVKGSLKGAPGDDGEDGAPGTPGTPGTSGGGGFHKTLVKPILSDFSWLGAGASGSGLQAQGAASAAQHERGILLTTPPEGVGTAIVWRGMQKTAGLPSTAYALTMGFTPNLQQTNYQQAGVALWKPSTGAYLTFFIVFDSSFGMRLTMGGWNGTSWTFDTITQGNGLAPNMPMFFHYTWNPTGSVQTYAWSTDGLTKRFFTPSVANVNMNGYTGAGPICAARNATITAYESLIDYDLTV